MKKLIANFLSCSLLFQSAVGYAEPTSGSEMLKDMEEQVRKFFPEILSISYDQLIQVEMVRRFGDFQNAVVKSIAAVSYSSRQLGEINEEVREISKEDRSEKRFLSLNWTRYATQKILYDLKVEGASIALLKEYWKHRCTKKYFENYLALYNPISLFSRDNFGPDIFLQKTPLHFVVGMTINENGNTTTSASLMPTDKTGEAIVGTSTTIGAVIGSMWGPLGTVIGSLIGSIVGSVVNFFVSAFKAHSEFKKQKYIKERIQDFMMSEIERLSEEREKLFLNICANYFPEDKIKEVTSTLQLLGERHKEVQDTAINLNIYLESEFADFPSNLNQHLQLVEREYLAELANKMTESQTSYLDDQVKTDKASVLFLRDKLFPILRSEQQAKGVVERLELREKLWQTKILGDTIFSRIGNHIFKDDDRLGPWKEGSDHVKEVIGAPL